jgi:hypothetical protein
MTLRIIAADPAGGNFGIGQATFPIISERLPSRKQRS